MNTFTYINNKMNIMSKRKPNKKTKKQQQQKRYEFSLKTQVRKHFFHLSLLTKLMLHNYTQSQMIFVILQEMRVNASDHDQKILKWTVATPKNYLFLSKLLRCTSTSNIKVFSTQWLYGVKFDAKFLCTS